MWVTNEKPALDVIVLVRLNSDEFPIWVGFCDASGWHFGSGLNQSISIQVIGWMPLSSGVFILDRSR